MTWNFFWESIFYIYENLLSFATEKLKKFKEN